MAIDFCSQPDRIGLLFDPKESQLILYHMVRLLHNYLASAKTLVEHTRTVIRDWYKGSEFLKEYKEEVTRRFNNNPLSAFIEDLRNYALHYSLPITGLRVGVVNDPTTHEQSERVTFFVDKTTLFQWSNWSKGKMFLHLADDEIVIEKLADDYYQQVIEFHAWMHNRLEQIHASDLKWLNDMQQRVNLLLRGERNLP